jgi:hypothetical protein
LHTSPLGVAIKGATSFSSQENGVGAAIFGKRGLLVHYSADQKHSPLFKMGTTHFDMVEIPNWGVPISKKSLRQIGV